MRRAEIALIAFLALGVALLSGYFAFALSDSGDGAAPVATLAGAPSLPSPSSPSPVVARPALATLVIGDAYVIAPAAGTGPSWLELAAQRLGWSLATDGIAGSGYLRGSSYPSRFEKVTKAAATTPPSLVVLTGGNADRGGYAGSKVAAAIAHEIELVHTAWPAARVVLFSPWAFGSPDASYAAFAQVFAQVAREQDATYVDVGDFLSKANLGTDRVHPTSAGQQEIAEHVVAALQSLS